MIREILPEPVRANSMRKDSSEMYQKGFSHVYPTPTVIGDLLSVGTIGNNSTYQLGLRNASHIHWDPEPTGLPGREK
jgi:hypothetical protein